MDSHSGQSSPGSAGRVKAARSNGESAQDGSVVESALRWLSERTRVTPTEWSLGIESVVRALLSESDGADGLYRDSLARLGRAGVGAQLARVHLIYGEWLRRERRRADARQPSRTVTRRHTQD